MTASGPTRLTSSVESAPGPQPTSRTRSPVRDAREVGELRGELDGVDAHEAVIRLGRHREAHLEEIYAGSGEDGDMRVVPSTARRRRRMRTADGIEIRRLDGADAREHLDGLAAVLADCVEGGASVSYMAPFSHDDAREAFEGFVADAERGRRLILAAFDDGELVGTVQVVLALPPNQPHRGEIAKLLVRRSARGAGSRGADGARRGGGAGGGQDAARARHRDRRSAERLYEAMGWTSRRRGPGLCALSRRPAVRRRPYFWKAVGQPSRP